MRWVCLSDAFRSYCVTINLPACISSAMLSYHDTKLQSTCLHARSIDKAAVRLQGASDVQCRQQVEICPRPARYAADLRRKKALRRDSVGWHGRSGQPLMQASPRNELPLPGDDRHAGPQPPQSYFSERLWHSLLLRLLADSQCLSRAVPLWPGLVASAQTDLTRK